MTLMGIMAAIYMYMHIIISTLEFGIRLVMTLLHIKMPLCHFASMCLLPKVKLVSLDLHLYPLENVTIPKL